MIAYKGIENFPFNLIEVVLNNSCPLDCNYCFLHNQGVAENMTQETLDKVFEFCLASKKKCHREYISIMMSLKEPFLSFDKIKNTVEKYFNEIYDNGIFVTINTNGVLVTDERIRWCREHCIDVHISLDGPKDIHDRGRVYRGNKQGSSWEKVMSLITTHPDYKYFSFMTTIHKQDLDRVSEIFNFMSNLPISCWVYALDNNDDWDDETLKKLEEQIKHFIRTATPQQLAKSRFQNTAAAFPNLMVQNGIKILQDGTASIQPPTPNDGAKKGWFQSKVIIGNVNTGIEIPEIYQNTSYKDYRICGSNCSSDCIMYSFCKQGEREIYVSDFSCRRVQHFARMAEYAKGGSMTDQEYQKIRDTYPIYSAVINVTDGCNLRCPYCFTEHNSRQMDMGTMKAAISFIVKECERFNDFQGKPNIAFFGGEPMLRFDDIIKPTIEWCEETGLREKWGFEFSMTTNGTLFTEERLQWLKEHNCGILLSIDGDKYTQDDQRPGANGSSSFDKIEPMIPVILKYFPYTTFRSAIEPRNVGHMVENYLFARKRNFLHYFITPNVDTNWSLEQIALACEQLAIMGDIYYNDINRGQIPLVWDELEQMIKDIFTRRESETISYNHCGIGTNSVGISCNGDLNGCQEHNTYIEHDIFHIGNIFTGIDKEKHKRLLSEFRAIDHPVCKEMPQLCEACTFKDTCASHFCPSHNLGKSGHAVENPLVVCMWKRFLWDMALGLIQRAEAEKSENFRNYFLNVVSGIDRGFAAW